MKLILMLFIAFNLWAGLPKKAEGDRYFVSAKSSMERGDYRGAKSSFEEIEKLDVSLAHTAEFHYFYAKTLSQTGDYQKGMEQIKQFLHRSGEKTKYYNEALEVYNFCESRDLSSKGGSVQVSQSYRQSNCVNGLCFSEDEGLKMNWYDADKYCQSKGRRLPTIRELKNAYLADGGDNKRVPNGFLNQFYWSSSKLDTNSAYYFNFNAGSDSSWGSMHQNYYVRCINR